MTPRAWRAGAAASLVTVLLLGSFVTLAALPTTRVTAEHRSVEAAGLATTMRVTVGAGGHVTILSGRSAMTVDQEYFLTPCGADRSFDALHVSCPGGWVERLLEPSRVWVVITLPPGTRVDAEVSRDAFFRAGEGITVTSLQQLLES